jgi:hypothetical protein
VRTVPTKYAELWIQTDQYTMPAEVIQTVVRQVFSQNEDTTEILTWFEERRCFDRCPFVVVCLRTGLFFKPLPEETPEEALYSVCLDLARAILTQGRSIDPDADHKHPHFVNIVFNDQLTEVRTLD